MILEIDNVELYFKHKRILNGIYLKAETGRVTGILGRNGSGKSCLMDIIFGNLKPKYKLLRLDNTPILKPLYQSHLVSYLPQYDFIPKSFKLKSIFKFYNVDWGIFSEIFTEFHNFHNTKIGKLSGGERRCIEIYVTLQSQKPIILLDEPFNGISPLMIERIKSLIAVSKNEKIIILSDHRYNDVLEISDQIYLLKNGSTTLIKNRTDLEDYGYLST